MVAPKFPLWAVSLALLAPGARSTSSSSFATPLSKVIDLLRGMIEKGEYEMNEEKKRYAEFSAFCEHTAEQKKKSIAEAERVIAELTAAIGKAEAVAEELLIDIKKNDAKLDKWEGEYEAGAAQRKGEKEEYAKAHKDLSDAVYALENAIEALKKRSADVPQSMVELSKKAAIGRQLSSVPVALRAWLQMGDAAGAPEANAYEFQSQGIIDMLEKLLKKFKEELTECEKEEMARQMAWEGWMQGYTDDTGRLKEVNERKTAKRMKELEFAANAKIEVKETEEVKADDEKYLKDLEVQCAVTGDKFAERQKLRALELEAVQKAIEVLSSPEVAGAADKHLTYNAKEYKVTSLAQLRSATKPADAQSALTRVAEFLERRAESSGSRLLGMLATRAASDPFAKVKKMIKDLIAKLKAEAAAEADHKYWCDKELATNKATREEKTAEIDELRTSVDELTAKIAKLADYMAELSEALTELAAATAKATELRTAEKAKNEETIKDAAGAQAALTQAITILKEFYAKAGEATALLQQPPEEDRQGGPPKVVARVRDDAPFVFDEPYKGMADLKDGPLGLLEVILSDFARLEADTRAGEEAAALQYKEFMRASAVDKASKETDLKHTTSRREDFIRELAETKKDLEATEAELQAALEYYDKLKPSCVDSNFSWEERIARREAEIESLKEALAILNGEDFSPPE